MENEEKVLSILKDNPRFYKNFAEIKKGKEELDVLRNKDNQETKENLDLIINQVIDKINRNKSTIITYCRNKQIDITLEDIEIIANKINYTEKEQCKEEKLESIDEKINQNLASQDKSLIDKPKWYDFITKFRIWKQKFFHIENEI